MEKSAAETERVGGVGSRGVETPFANIRGLYESNWIYGIYTLQCTPQVTIVALLQAEGACHLRDFE